MSFDNIRINPKKNKKNPYRDPAFFPNTFHKCIIMYNVSDMLTRLSLKVNGLASLYKPMCLITDTSKDFPTYKFEGRIVSYNQAYTETLVDKTYMTLDFIIEPGEDHKYEKIEIVIKYAKDFFRDLKLQKVPFTGVPKNASYEMVVKEVERGDKSGEEIMELYKVYLEKYLNIVETYIIENKRGDING